MSIEYTIDIQLTELGFPDILQQQETSVRETASRSPAPLAGKQRLISAEDAGANKRRPRAHQPAGSPAPPRSQISLQLQDGQTAKDTVLSSEDRPSAGPDPAHCPDGDSGRDFREAVPALDNSAKGQPDEEEDSDDSEVSDVYEEEEAEDDDDEEEEDYEVEEGQNEPSEPCSYHCNLCSLQLPSKFKLQDHMNLHTGARPYCCAECGKRFCQIYNYRVHLRTHAQTKVDRLVCRICLVGFTSQEDLQDHLSKTHFEDEFYECDLCKRVFTSLKACESHVMLHKCMLDVVCEICGRNFSNPKSLARHRRKICNSKFKCADCTQIFTKKNALLKHSFSHLGLLPYTCVRCNCHFRLAKLYRQHKCEPERIHCVACLREFVSQADFEKHKKDTGCWGSQGSKGDEIRCLECGEKFDSSEELKKHAGAHQRVLKCAECGKGFRSALLLMSHMGGHAGKSPCLCQICGLGFPHQQNYDSHLKTCGQTPQPVSAPKKRQAPKSSSSEAKKLNAKQDLSHQAKTVLPPAVDLNKFAKPVEDPVSPGVVTEVSPTQHNGQAVSSAAPQTLPAPYLEVQSQVSQPAVLSDGHLGPGNKPLDLVTRINQDPECEAPLDLSKKCNSSKSIWSDLLLSSVKNEPEEFEIAGEVNRQEHKSSDSKLTIKMNPGEAGTEITPMKMSPMDLSPHGRSFGVRMKKEPPSPGSDLSSSKTYPLIDWKSEREIKMEVDVSPSASVDEEK
ncbi:zinc finger and SCAN domain-containing protein 10 isoform X2 [Echeneis naucrates]|uniref:Zinc finger and SCAN domain-containing protein 10-like n=1 Tax=Echeneis naucrates TaxID=173247 RepID=A0A665T158_ECHNA|nr:zinc finger and SCAN domain-containing protein 10-like isoform X2 [Echeneis naucrates]